MDYSKYVCAVPVISRNLSTITDHFLPINPLGLPKACYYLKIANDSNYPVAISYGDDQFHDFIQSGHYLEIDTGMNDSFPMIARWKNGQIIYALGLDYPFFKPLGSIKVIGYTTYNP